MSTPTPHRLTIELVPGTTWEVNLRSLLTTKAWDAIRKGVYRAANYRCEVCGGKGPKHPVECHEKWHYDDAKWVQTLVGLEALCPMCHKARHIGLAIHLGLGPAVIAHLQRVNGIGVAEAKAMVREAFAVWAKRSEHVWTVDTSWLTKGDHP